jgi:hypothetical protein
VAARGGGRHESGEEQPHRGPVAAAGLTGDRPGDPGPGQEGEATYLPFFCFLAARFSFRFFWADFLEALPPPLSLPAMRAIYRIKEESARPPERPTLCPREDSNLRHPV